jgi:hypothetical protein
MSFGPLRLLALLTLILATGLAWMWLDQHGKPRNLAWVTPKPLTPDIKVPVSAGLIAATAANPSMFAVILERPLFAPDRRPPPPPAAAPPPDPFATIKIQGIFSGANAGILANVDSKTRRVKINETIGNWTLKSIDGRDITFTQGDDHRTVRLTYARLDAPASQNPKANAQAASAPVPASAVTPAPGAVSLPQTAQDEARERLRRRNELRTSRGLPPVTE